MTESSQQSRREIGRQQRRVTGCNNDEIFCKRRGGRLQARQRSLEVPASVGHSGIAKCGVIVSIAVATDEQMSDLGPEPRRYLCCQRCALPIQQALVLTAHTATRAAGKNETCGVVMS